MLKSITLENFKPFGSGHAVRLAPITLIYGPNSSGKSSLIQSLLLMRQTFTQQGVRSKNDLITSGSFVNLGSFLSLLHKHEKTRKLKIGFEFAEMPENDLDPCFGLSLLFSANSYGRSETLPLLEAIEFQSRQSKGIDSIFSFGLNRTSPKKTISGDFKFSSDTNFDPLIEVVKIFIERENRQNRLEKNKKNKSLDALKIDVDIDTLRKLVFNSIGVYPIDKSYLPSWPELKAKLDPIDQNFMSALHSFLQSFDIRLLKTVGNLTYLGPLRTHPERLYEISGMPEGSVGSQGERTIQILYDDYDIAVSKGEKTLIDKLNDYCEQFQIPYVFEVKSIGSEITGDIIVLSLTDRRTGVKVAPTDVGFGIGQILPILIEGMVAKRRGGKIPRIICVEQPEIHLHPRMQASMADFFIDTALTTHKSESKNTEGKGVQWILETHSETLMLRIQRRIREGVISPQDVSVLYVDPCGERGSIIEELRLDEDGEFIDVWPDGFFVEGFNEIFGGK